METKINEEEEEEIFEFDLVIKHFNLKIWLIYYPWLSSLFGITNEESTNVF